MSHIDRRTFLVSGGAAALVCVGAGLGLRLPRRRQLYRHTTTLMGSFGEVQVVHDDARHAAEAIDLAFAEGRRIERLMTRFDSTSDIGRANLAAALSPVNVTRETAAVVDRALRWARATNGVFDPALGRVTALWDVERRTEVPAADEVEALEGRSFFRNVRLTLRDDGPASVRFDAADVALDLGGIAKGYAVDRAVEVLREAGIDAALVNFGGDVRALGAGRGGEPWRVGVRDPFKPDRIARVLKLKDESVATSGNYERFFVERATGRRYHHLIRPATARPGRSTLHSLTVVGRNGADADALATGLFFLDDNDSQRFVENHTDGVRTIRLA